MEQNLQSIIAEASKNMENSCSFLSKELSKVKTGRANPEMLDTVRVNNYEQLVPISQIASITAPDSKTLLIKPWEKKAISAIEKAIITSKLDLIPRNNGDFITITIPPNTEERRKSIVKQIKVDVENSKVSIRNIRNKGKDSLKKLDKLGISKDEIKSGEEQLQKITNSYIAKVDNLADIKEKEIMTL